MLNFSELKRISLREIWKNEASDFTTWLESNIQTLGTALDMDIEITSREASVGDFSLRSACTRLRKFKNGCY